MAGSKEIKITIVGDASSVATAMKTASGAADGLDKSLGTVVKTAAGFALGNAISQAPGFLMDAAKAAAADEQSMNKLKQAVTNADGSYDKYGKTIDDAISKGQKLAFSDDETRNALTTLISETGSTEEAMKRLGTAQDLARGTGMSLEQAAKLLGKTSDENTSALARYGIVVEKGATAQDVLNEVDARYKGQAGTYAESAAGQLAIMQDKAGELQESLGYILLPILAGLTAAMIAVVDAISKYVVPAFQSMASVVGPIFDAIGGATPILIALAPVLGAIGVAIMASVVPAFTTWIGETYAQVAAMTILNAELLPVIAIALAIGVAIAALYVAWSSNFLGIQDITHAVLDAVMPYIQTALSTIQTVFETVWPIISQVVTTYIGLVRAEIETALTVIQAVWGVAWPAIQVIVEGVMTAISTAVQIGMGIVDVISTALGAIRTAFDTVFVPVQGVVSDVIDTVSRTVSTGIGGVKDTINNVLTDIRDNVWNPIWNGFTGTVQTVVDTVSRIVGGIINLINGAIGNVNSALDFSINIPGLSIAGHDIIPATTFSFNAPDIPLIPNPFGGSSANGVPNNTSANFVADSISNGGGGSVGPPLQKPVNGGGGPGGGGFQKPVSGGSTSPQAAAEQLKQAGLRLQVANQRLQAAIATGDPMQIAQAQYEQQQAILAYQSAYDAYQAAVMAPPATTPGTGAPGSGPSGGVTPTPAPPAPFNPLNTLNPVGGAYQGGGNGAYSGGVYMKTANGYSEFAAAIRQAIKDGMREAMSGAMG